jgi:hypothetical protein
MADVTGPISTLPGSAHGVPSGTMCDDHPTRPAVARVQGETDSMGSEMLDLCQQCLDALRAEPHDTSGRCDWCKTDQPARVPTRDYEEGSCGPVYYVCAGCRSSYFKSLRDAADELDWG